MPAPRTPHICEARLSKIKAALLPGLVLLAAGCAQKPPTVVSGDTPYEMQSSIVMLTSNLSPGRKEEFTQAISTVIFSATDRRLAYDGDRLSPQAMKMLRGRSVHQVIEDAKLLRAAARF
jgi:hypothetical protein